MQTIIQLFYLDVWKHELQIICSLTTRKFNIKQVKKEFSIHRKLNAELQ